MSARHTELPRTDLCPCCGAIVEASRVLIDLETNIVQHGGRAWRVSPQAAVMLHVLNRALPRTVSVDLLGQALYGFAAPEGRQLRRRLWNVTQDARKVVRCFGGDVVHVSDCGYRLAFTQADNK